MKLITNSFVQSLDADTDMSSILAQLKNRLNNKDPFFICKLPNIVEKFLSWRRLFPRVKPYYGVNNNSSCIIMETLAAMGVGFQCTTKKDIIETLNVDSGNSIVLTSMLKTDSLMRFAASSKVPFISFDSESELDKMKKWYPEANLLFHVRTSYDPKLSICFGADPDFQFIQLMKKARALDFNVVGLHFNIEPEIGTQAYTKIIELAKRLFDEANAMGFKFNFLSLGSGFPSDSLNEVAEEVNQALNEHFPEESIEIVADAAQFFVESAYTLTCQVEFVLEVDKINQETQETHKHYEYYINDGVFGSFNNVFTNKQNLKLRPLKDYPESKTFSSSIWGPSGSDLDNIVEDISLPKMNIGDSIIFDNMGMGTASYYNGCPIQKVYFLTDDEVWLKVCGEQKQPKELYFVMGNHTEQMKGRRKNKYSEGSFEAPNDMSGIIPLQSRNETR